MKVLIIGAGAIGGSLACYLSKSQASVTVLEKNQELCDVINANGMYLRDGEKNYRITPRVVSNLSEGDSFDCCFSATRAYHMSKAIENVLPYIKKDGVIVSMNNGVCIEPMLDVVEEERAVWCSINFGAGIEGVGKYFTKIHGNIVIGQINGKRRGAEIVKSIFENTDLEVQITDNILGALYSKMLINSCITSTAVVSGLTLGDILGRREGKRVFKLIIREGVEVAKNAGITIPNYGGKLNYYAFAGKGLVGLLYRTFVFPYLRKKYGERTSATLEALKKGTKTEIDYFNGYVLRLGEKFGVKVSMNKAVVETVKEVEKDLESIGEQRLIRLARTK